MTPIKYMPGVFDAPSDKFAYFLAPGVLSLLAFTHAIAITAVSFVSEKGLVHSRIFFFVLFLLFNYSFWFIGKNICCWYQ